MFHHNLCYGSISEISANHNARNFKNRKECKVCKKRHPTSLHGNKAEKSKDKQPYGNSSEESNVNGYCLVQHKLSNCSVKTYAMLDNYMQSTFMRKK